jgi:hypothetical protein
VIVPPVVAPVREILETGRVKTVNAVLVLSVSAVESVSVRVPLLVTLRRETSRFSPLLEEPAT